MSTDDPQLTAYALNELPPAEAANIARLIALHQGAALEVQQAREVAAVLRDAFHAELDATLADRHRAAIFQAAAAASRSAFAVAPGKIIAHPAWWSRPGLWQAAAACVIVGLSVWAITLQMVAPGEFPRSRSTTGVDEMRIRVDGMQPESIPTFAATDSMRPVEPALQGNQPAVPLPGVSAMPYGQPAISANPSTLAQGVPAQLPAVPNPVELPHVVGSDDPLAQIRSAASIGRAPNKGITYGAARIQLPTATGTVTLIGAEAQSYLQAQEYLGARWEEIRTLREGSPAADLARYFRPVPGAPGKHAMVKCPQIQVDVEFSEDGATVRKISAPYFVPER